LRYWHFVDNGSAPSYRATPHKRFSRAHHSLLASSTALWQLYLTQALDAWVVAVVMGLGLAYAQHLSPDRAGLASGTFGSSYGVAIVVGNLIGSASVPLLGVPHVFVIPTALCVVSLLTFLGIERASRQRLEQDIALSRRSGAG
jgi:MFS family permease